jgi:KaiC/GvpD/RAD55 family RecA-like ATPase
MLSKIGLKEIPERSVLLIEEDLGSIKHIFVQRIGFEAVKTGKCVVYITPKLKEDVNRQMSVYRYGLKHSGNFEIIENFRDRDSLSDVCDGDISIIDPFTYLFVDSDINELINTLNSFIASSRKDDRIFLLTSDMGVIPGRAERIMRSLVDGVIQFLVVYSGDRINRFINIPKLNGTQPLDSMIPFTVGEEGIAIDTRERIE